MQPEAVTRHEVDACAFTSWFPQFKHISMASRVIPLEDAFVEYLLDNGPLFLPTREASEDGKKQQGPHFPGLLENIDQAIKSLGGAVLPKLNWSSPKDAAWIAPNQSMRCTSAEDVMLLLKSSECIQHDLTMPYAICGEEARGDAGHADGPSEAATDKAAAQSYQLVLRNWFDMHPGYEFRCFVDRHKLFAITQRHADTHDASLVDRKDDIMRGIYYFFQDHIKEEFSIESYIFDVYYDKGRVWLVDFNPLSPVSDAGLFSWDEISSLRCKRHEPFVDDTAYASDEQVEQLLALHAKMQQQQQEKEKEKEKERAAVAQGAAEGSSDDEPPSAAEEEAAPERERSLTDELNKQLLVAFQGALDGGEAAPSPLSAMLKTVPQTPQAGQGPSPFDDDDDDEREENEEEDVDGGADKTEAAPGMKEDAGEEESEHEAMRRVEMRVVQEQPPLRSGKFAAQAFPRDVLEIASTGDVNVMIEAMKEAAMQQAEDTDGDDDDDDDDEEFDDESDNDDINFSSSDDDE